MEQLWRANYCIVDPAHDSAALACLKLCDVATDASPTHAYPSSLWVSRAWLSDSHAAAIQSELLVHECPTKTVCSMTQPGAPSTRTITLTNECRRK